jgi:hypothetical protein
MKRTKINYLQKPTRSFINFSGKIFISPGSLLNLQDTLMPTASNSSPFVSSFYNFSPMIVKMSSVLSLRFDFLLLEVVTARDVEGMLCSVSVLLSVVAGDGASKETSSWVSETI